MSATPGTRTLHLVGMSDEQTDCDQCGRVELRGTVIVADSDGNEIGRYGTTCAGKILGQRVTRAYAVSAEACRRRLVVADLRDARRAHDAGNRALALSWVRSARSRGLIRSDEIALAEKIAG